MELAIACIQIRNQIISHSVDCCDSISSWVKIKSRNKIIFEEWAKTEFNQKKA